MTTEFERMRQGEVYDFMDPEIHASLTHARKACAAFRKLDTLHFLLQGEVGRGAALDPRVPRELDGEPAVPL